MCVACESNAPCYEKYVSPPSAPEYGYKALGQYPKETKTKILDIVT